MDGESRNRLEQSKEQVIDKTEAMEMVLNLGVDDSMGSKSVGSFWYNFLGEWEWDTQDDMITCNNKRFSALGYKKKGEKSSGPYSFFSQKIHPEDSGKVKKEMIELLEGESKLLDIEYRILDLQGTYRTFYERAVIIRKSDSGKPLAVWGLGFDITQLACKTAICKPRYHHYYGRVW